MQNDKITIGIPIYNAAEWVERSLLSALNQTYPDIEYILVDDKGNSMDIVRRVLKTHPRGKDVRIIAHEKNEGISAARNTALRNATGRYFFTMDCDDTLTPDCIARLYAAMCEHPVDFVAASFVQVDVEGNRYGGTHYQRTLIEGEAGSHAVAAYRYEKKHYITVASWNKLYDMDFLRRNQISYKEENTLMDDILFTYQVVLCANSCLLLPDVTLYYLCHSKSVSGKVTLGYSERVARQFANSQKVIENYTASLAHYPVYRSLLTDIMKMSLYYSYRIAESPFLSLDLQRELIHSLLHLDTPSPQKGAGRHTPGYMALRLFFALPMSLKLGIVRFMAVINLKQKIRRWIHF